MSMKTITMVLAVGQATVDYYLPVKDPCRLVGAFVGTNKDLSADATAKLQIGKGTDYVLEIAANKALGKTASATKVDTTEAKLNQIFDKDEPIKINAVSAVAGTVYVLQLVVDPFLIGKHKGLATS